MKTFIFITLFFSLFIICSAQDGGECIGCAIGTPFSTPNYLPVEGVRILQQLTKITGTPEAAMKKLCDVLPADFYAVCKAVFFVYGKSFAENIRKGLNPDDTCLAVGLCSDPKCRMFPKHYTTSSTPSNMYKPPQDDTDVFPYLSSWWEELLRRLGFQQFIETFKTHLPYYDSDKDRFSGHIFGDLRGYSWRGKDCDDKNNRIYPGRKTPEGSAGSDYNCNGIHGINSQTGKTWKEELCTVEQRGLIVLGDSATAHFSIPAKYVDLTNWSDRQYRNLMNLFKHEADWPFTSWATGYKNDTSGDNPGKVDSIYLRLRKRNLCNHRDYQNICVNGARTGAIADKLIKTMSRNQTTDHPALVFYAPIGNDICSPSGGMADPQKFHDNVIRSLDILERVLPRMSYVVFIGVVDGRILWDQMHYLTHPVGTKYEHIYEYLTCLRKNPCPQWLTKNETRREEASARARLLNAQYHKIMRERGEHYKNFKMYYMDFPFEEIGRRHFERGGRLSDLIDPFDGFHPSQIAQNLLAEEIWEHLEKHFPEALGPVNPNNAEIARRFGNQGGHE